MSSRWPQITAMDNEQGLETVLKPPMYVFFLFFQNFFYTNMNFLIKWTTSSNATTNSSTLMSQPHQRIKTALAQHKKCPNNGSYHCLGLRYAHYECHVTTTATNHHNWRQMGAQDGSRALMYVFFLFYFFYFYTNMNFLLNRHYHQQDNTNVSTMSTHQDSTLEHRKRPKWWYILSFGL